MNIQETISSGILELYVLGIATSGEKKEVEELIKQYPKIKTEINAISEALEFYSIQQSISPSPGIKKQLVSKLNLQNPEISKSSQATVVSMRPYLKWAAIASVLLLLGSALFNIIYFNKYQEAEIARTSAEQQLLVKSEEISSMNKGISIVQNKYSKPVALEGLPASPDAAAKIFWMKNTGEVYIDPSNLPPAPAGKQYQLWAIIDGKPVSGGMISFTDKPGKFVIQKMRSFGRAEAFAITLEKKGGNPTPEGEMYVLGKI